MKKYRRAVIKRIPTKNEYQKKSRTKKSVKQRKNQMVTSSLLEAEKRLLGLISQSKKLYKMIVGTRLKPMNLQQMCTDVWQKVCMTAMKTECHPIRQ